MSWDDGCSNPNFRPDAAQYYVSLHASEGGFRNQFNLQANWDDPALLSFGTWGCPHRQFRVYIPPGAVQINMNFFAPNGALIGTVQRFKRPPQLNYCGVNPSNFPVMPWSGHKVLSQLEEADGQIMNMGGGFFALVQPIKAPGLLEGGWLYFKLLDVDEANDIFQFQYVVQVNRATYLAWYNNHQTRWNDHGDPLPLEGGEMPAEPINVSLVGSVSSPVTVGTTVGFTAKGTGGSGQYEYRFWLKAGDNVWVSVQEYSNVNTWSWTPDKTGSYQIGVHIRDQGSTKVYEAIATLPYIVEAGPVGLKATIRIEGQQAIITLPEGVKWA